MKVEVVDSELITEDAISDLPYPVYNWLRNSGIVGKREIESAKLQQTVKMQLAPEQPNWFTTEATHYCTTQKPAFVWTVDFNVGGVLNIKGRDKYADGRGNMLITFFALFDIVNEVGSRVDEASMQRYLAEIVWYPSAALEPYVKWEAIDSTSARAVMEYEGVSTTGIFAFNELGECTEFKTKRFKGNDDSERLTWKVKVQKYGAFEGIHIPSESSIVWELETGDWEWLQVRVNSIEFNSGN